MQVTNHSNNKRNMKEELLEAIYGTVERLEQKVDELSASPKNAGGGNSVPVSIDTTKLGKVNHCYVCKRRGSYWQISPRLRDAICIFADLIKEEHGKDEQRSKLLFDAVKQVKQEHECHIKSMCRTNLTQWIIHLRRKL